VPLRHAEEGDEAEEEHPFVEIAEGTEGALPRARRHQPQVTCVPQTESAMVPSRRLAERPQCLPADASASALSRSRQHCRSPFFSKLSSWTPACWHAHEARTALPIAASPIAGAMLAQHPSLPRHHDKKKHSSFEDRRSLGSPRQCCCPTLECRVNSSRQLRCVLKIVHGFFSRCTCDLQEEASLRPQEDH